MSENQTDPIAEAHIVIQKRDRRLTVFKNGNAVKTCKMVLGFTPVGDKEAEGDGKTPEGEFYVFTKNDKSKYFLSLGLSYPGLGDARRGLEAGMITQAEHDEILRAINSGEMPLQTTALGGEIYIHGGGVDGDWTCGCVALNDDEMEEIFDASSVGMRVTIRP